MDGSYVGFPDHDEEYCGHKMATHQKNGRHFSEEDNERRKSINSIENQVKLRQKKKLKRLVEKYGSCNIIHCNVTRKGDFLRDGFTTLLDLQWRWVLFIFSVAYLFGWVLFAAIWYSLVWDHDDLDYRQNKPNWEPCVYNVDNFLSAFLFSVETQTTIGYGFRSVTEACWLGAALVVVQSVFSCLVDAVMIGCIFAKLARSKKRAATIKFSYNATIAERNGRLCFMFRLGDVRQSHVYDAKIRAMMVRPHVTNEGECIPLETFDMCLGNSQTTQEQIFLVWPIIMCHVIDENSPLYQISKKDLKKQSFEIIIIFEGVLEQTGLVMQARTSYLPSEILWGHRFTSHLIEPHQDDEHLVVDYREFNKTYQVASTPVCSAEEAYKLRAEGIEPKEMSRSRIKSVLKKVHSFENSRTSQNLQNGPFSGKGRGKISFVESIEEVDPQEHGSTSSSGLDMNIDGDIHPGMDVRDIATLEGLEIPNYGSRV